MVSNLMVSNIIGASDETHFRSDKPANDSESYINRKGYYSCQVSGVYTPDIYHWFIYIKNYSFNKKKLTFIG